jgi:MarR family transcriptional regulator for hemolysin
MEKALDIEFLRSHDIPGAKWKVIAVLAVNNGLNQKEVADFLSLDSSTLVPVIDKLEQGGFVTRKPDPKDRRNNRIFITKKSESAIDEIVDTILKIRKIFYKDISVQHIEIAKKVLQKMTENAESFISANQKQSENKTRVIK